MRHLLLFCAIDRLTTKLDLLMKMTFVRKARKVRRQPEEPLRVAACIDTRDGPGRDRLLGVYRYALERDWRLFLLREDNAKALREIAAMGVVGAIFFDRAKSLQQFTKAQGIVCVETSARNLELDDAAVYVDDAAIGKLAVAHLTGIGFEHISYCGLAGSFPSSLRSKGLVQAAQHVGLAATTFVDTYPEGETALSPMMRWLRELPKPVGVLVYDDKMAERVLAACRWAKIRVPDELGVLGIGNDELICELAYPSLSSIALPSMEIGRHAAQALDAILQGDSAARGQQTLGPTEVHIRASTDRVSVTNPTVAAAIKFIRESGHKPIGTDQIAAAVATPRRTLERWFRTSLGLSVHDYLVRIRIRQAKRLLSQSECSLGEVARLSGYSALTAFNRMFLISTGLSPEKYRNNNRLARPMW